jgi:hypothetical protein
MTIKIELPVTGNWLNWDLYTEEDLSPEQIAESLNIIRQELKKHIQEQGKKGYLYLLDLQLYADKNNDRFFKLSANVGGMPNNNFNAIGFDFKHDIVATAGGGEAALGTIPIRPVGPKGHLARVYDTPFIQMFNETRLNFAVGALISGHR